MYNNYCKLHYLFASMKSTSFRKPSIKIKHNSSASSLRHLLLLLVAFLTGCFFSSTILLHTYPLHQSNHDSGSEESLLPPTFAHQELVSSKSSNVADRKPIELVTNGFTICYFKEHALTFRRIVCFASFPFNHLYHCLN